MGQNWNSNLDSPEPDLTVPSTRQEGPWPASTATAFILGNALCLEWPRPAPGVDSQADRCRLERCGMFSLRGPF